MKCLRLLGITKLTRTQIRDLKLTRASSKLINTRRQILHSAPERNQYPQPHLIHSCLQRTTFKWAQNIRQVVSVLEVHRQLIIRRCRSIYRVPCERAYSNPATIERLQSTTRNLKRRIPYLQYSAQINLATTCTQL